MLIVVAALVAASAASIVVSTRADAVPVPWKNCGAPANPVMVQKFDASVWPPQRGKREVLSFSYLVAHDIDVGSRTLTVSPPGRLPAKLLKFLLNHNHVKAGPYSSPPAGERVNVPRSIPSGTVYTAHLSVLDQAGTQVFCLDMTIPVK